MHIVQPFQHLIDEVSNMILAEILSGIDDSMQIGLHQFSYDVVIFVAALGLGELQINH
jgi:hypothetical protein